MKRAAAASGYAAYSFFPLYSTGGNGLPHAYRALPSVQSQHRERDERGAEVEWLPALCLQS